MPFLIKSVNGKRSYQMVTNTNKDDAETKLRETIIDALKGLTFKFEIKITDVLSAEQTATPDKSSSADKKQVNVPIKKDEQTQGKLEQNGIDKPARARKVATYQRDELLALDRHPVNPLAETIEADHVSNHFENDDTLKRVGSSVNNTTRTNASFEHTIVKKPLPGKPKYPRGLLTIGSEMRTVCVAVDESEPPVAHIAYNSEEIANITNTIMDISAEIEAEPEVSTVHVGDIVFAKSTEDNEWYRAVVEGIKEQVYIQVHYLDWGLGETLSSKRIRRLNRPELGLSKHPACAVRIMFTNETHPKFDEVLSCQVEYDMKVVSYDEAAQIYKCTIIS